MANNNVNWEKIGVYMAIVASLITVIFYLFDLKEDISVLRERTAVLETKIKFKE